MSTWARLVGYHGPVHESTGLPNAELSDTPVARRHSRRWLRLTGAVMASVVLFGVAACSNDDSSSDSSDSASASASVSESPSASDSASDASASPSETVDPTVIDNLDSITVDGGFGTEPTITADWPIAVDQTMSSVLVSGNGAQVNADSTVEVNYHGVDARTGEVFDSSFSSGSTATFSLEQVITGFQTGLDGKHVGDRVLIAITGADGYDSAGGVSSAGIEVGDTLIFVVDVVSTTLSEPSGDVVTPDAGLPTVSGDINNPSISIPESTDPPTDLVSQALIQGSGKEVQATDTITVNYLEVNWADGSTIDSTYNDGSPEPQTGSLSALIDGWQQGLVGKTVGSRVLLVVPASQAYPEGNATPSIAPDTTLVFVVDILFTQSAS